MHTHMHHHTYTHVRTHTHTPHTNTHKHYTRPVCVTFEPLAPSTRQHTGQIERAWILNKLTAGYNSAMMYPGLFSSNLNSYLILRDLPEFFCKFDFFFRPFLSKSAISAMWISL